MSFFAIILTVFMVLNCALLILLILVQLPKKDAGAGLAFGGGAADALFGAGSGNVLTKVTKWAAVVFFGMALVLGYLQDRLHNNNSTSVFEKQLEQKQSQQPAAFPQAAPAPAPAAPAAMPSQASSNSLLPMPLTAPTNAPAAPAQSK